MESIEYDFVDVFVDGTYLISVFDGVLSEESWPVHLITVEAGRVVSQKVVFSATSAGVSHSIPDMVGWTTDMLNEWSDYDQNDPMMTEHGVKLI